MSLMKMIAEYDADREAYIAELRAENEDLRHRLIEALNTSIKSNDNFMAGIVRLAASGRFAVPASKSGGDDNG